MVINKSCSKCGQRLVWNDYVHDKPCQNCGAIPSVEESKKQSASKEKLIQVTEEQFGRSLEILTKSCRKNWHSTTEKLISKKIGEAQDKEATISAIEKAMDKYQNEADFLDAIK